jgi:hypothetical protein
VNGEKPLLQLHARTMKWRSRRNAKGSVADITVMTVLMGHLGSSRQTTVWTLWCALPDHMLQVSHAGGGCGKHRVDVLETEVHGWDHTPWSGRFPYRHLGQWGGSLPLTRTITPVSFSNRHIAFQSRRADLAGLGPSPPIEGVRSSIARRRSSQGQ